VRKVRRIRIKPHLTRRNGKAIRVRGHYRNVITSREQGRSGEHFKALEDRIYKEYRKKGYSEKRARSIARATAGKVFWQKYGKVRGKRILKREK